MRLFALTVLLTLPLHPFAAEAEDVTELLESRWFNVEVLVFQREPAPTEADGEMLLKAEAPVLPGTVLQLLDGSRYPLELDAETADEAFNFRMGRGRALGYERPRRRARAASSTPQDAEVAEAVEPEEPTARELFDESLREFETDLVGQTFVPQETLALTEQAAKLTRGNRNRILMHERWLQAVPPRGQATPILVQREALEDHRYRLEGALGVTVGRYLHVHAELWLAATQMAPELLETPSDDRIPVFDISETEPVVEVPAPVEYLVLNERRRMKSDELHYIDHPSFGLLVMIQPLEIPEMFVEALTALEEADER